jgi:hypothetical protein
MNKVDLKINAIANAKMYHEILLAPDGSALSDLLDTLMDSADKRIDYDLVRDELEELIIRKAVEYSRAA